MSVRRRFERPSYLHDEWSEEGEVDAGPAVHQPAYLGGAHQSVLLTLQLVDALGHLPHRAQSRHYHVTLPRVAIVVTQHVLHSDNTTILTIVDSRLRPGSRLTPT